MRQTVTRPDDLTHNPDNQVFGPGANGDYSVACTGAGPDSQPDGGAGAGAASVRRTLSGARKWVGENR